MTVDLGLVKVNQKLPTKPERYLTFCDPVSLGVDGGGRLTVEAVVGKVYGVRSVRVLRSQQQTRCLYLSGLGLCKSHALLLSVLLHVSWQRTTGQVRNNERK